MPLLSAQEAGQAVHPESKSNSSLASNQAPSQLRREYLRVLEFVGEICWILSEVTWILLIPQACLPLGFLAFMFLGAVATRTCTSARLCELEQWLPSTIQAHWLLTNFCWMLAETLWDSPDRPTPWDLTPMVRNEDSIFDRAQWYCVVSFLAPPALWALALAALAIRGWKQHGRSQLSLRPARALFFQAGYLASWALIDAVWAANLFWLSMLSCVVTIGLIIGNASWETEMGLRGVDRTDIVWVLWTLSNLLWIVMELKADEDLLMRYLAAFLGTAALALLLCSRRQARARADIRVGAPSRALQEPLAVAAPGMSGRLGALTP